MLNRAWLVFSLLSILPAALCAQVSAGFTISIPTSNCNPAVYSFINTSTGTGLTYAWNFGVFPGVNSIFQNPSTTYLGCGTFAVKLVVTDVNGAKDSSMQTVNIRCSPKADFGSAFTAGCLPLTTNFTSNATAGSGTIATYVWDFGDGSSGTGINPTHTYQVSGCKNVTLIVTNTFGCVSDTTLSNLLCVYQPPVSNFTSSAQSSCTTPLLTTYQANSTGGTGPYTYNWIFAGGTPATSTLANPAVTYNTPGSFGTTLITTDAHGCSDTLIKNNYINVANYTASFTIDTGLRCAPATVTVNSVSSLNPLAWHWQVSTPGIAVSPNAQNTTLTLPNSGTYNTCLTISYAGGCNVQKCAPVTVNAPPVSYFGTSGALFTCQVPDVITYIDSSVGNNLTYQWSFPFGLPSSSTLQQPAPVIYNNCGNYNVTLTVNDANGCTATYTKNNFLHISCLRAFYTVTPATGCLPLAANFNSNGSGGNPVSYLWDFDDPNSGTADSSTLPNPTHTFNYPGCYTVKLTTITAQGCVYVDSIPDGVCAGFKPHANFSANPPLNCANKPIYFTDSTTNTYSYTTYAWDFHNTGPIIIQSTQQNPSYIYNDVGTYDITLIVSNYGCADTITKDNLVQTVYPLAVPVAIKNCGNPLEVTLDGSRSEGAQTYKWIIVGGGVPDSALTQNVLVNFPGPGTYNASLYVTDDTTGCDDLANVVINIANAAPQFTGSPLTGCTPITSCMTTIAPDITRYQWTVTNQAGITDTTATATNPCFHFTQPGFYNVQLITADTFGCFDTIYKPDYIKVSHAVANFVGTPLFGCVPLTANFLDSSVTAAGVAKWTWNFGDLASGAGDSSHLQNPVHIFNQAGNYSVQLNVIDSNGCTGDSLKINYVIADKPHTTFTTAGQHLCYGSNICFIVDSVNTKYTYLWNFDDGTTADTANVCHLYTGTGTFAITLIATDSAGCADTLTAADTSQVTSVQPHFTADDTLTTCPPLTVHFTNLTTGADSVTAWHWTFGDGQVSTLQNPFHIYTVGGLFTVTLVAYTANGCSDTIVDTNYIRITGPSANVSVAPTSGCVPHYTCMSAVSNSAISYTWNFGDGTVLPGTDSVCYTYTRTGTFFPELILNDRGGCIFALPMGTVNVLGTVAAFTTDTPVLCRLGSVQFTDSSYGNSNVQTYNWNFGDPASGTLNTSALQNPTHFFAAPGTYHVTQNIISVDGCLDSAGHNITVNPPPVVSISISDTTPCAPVTISFTGNSSSVAPITSFVWNFGDTASGNANTSAQPNATHTYNTQGIYYVTISVTDSNSCTANTQGTVTVHPKPVAAFTAFDTCLNTQPIVFTNTSQAASSYQWSFGDGNTSTLSNPTYSYNTAGSFTAQLIAQTAFCSDTVAEPVQIFSVPVAAFTVSTRSLCGLPAMFTTLNQSTGADGYLWYFGNDSSSTLLNPAINFQTTGTFNIVLTALTNHGCIDTATQSVIVYPKPTIQQLQISPAQGCQPVSVSLSANATNTSGYSWNFGAGTVTNPSSSSSASYTYTDTGAYTISLYLNSLNQCTDTLVLTDTVKIYTQPVAAFTVSTGSMCGPPAVFTTLNQSTGADTYLWNFGNNTSSLQVNPSVSYSSAGNFNIMLYALTNHGCIDSATQPVIVYPKPAIQNLEINPAEGCQPLHVSFGVQATNAATYSWNFGTGQAPDISTMPTANNIYNDTGAYTISLYLTSANQCTDTLVLPDTIKVYAQPVANFEPVINSSGYPYNGTVVFLNQSKNASTYWWNFGDGSTSTDSDPEHRYETIDSFSTLLVASTPYGCVDSIIKTFYVIKKSLYVPNALQPGYEGSQSLVKVWKPVGIGLLTYQARVFDKWGELLWESDSIQNFEPAEGWDGTYQGKPCQQDVYVWKVNATFLDGTVWPGMLYNESEGGGEKTIGSITLIR